MGTNSEDDQKPLPKRELTKSVNELLTRQAGVIGYSQLRDVGIASQRIRRRVSGGELVRRTSWPRSGSGRSAPASPPKATRLRPGDVFSSNGAPLSIDAVRWSAVLSAPHGSGRLAGVSSCALLDLTSQRGLRMHVIRLGGGWNAPKSVVAHRTTHLPDEDLGEERGVPCLSVARSLFDAATDVSAKLLDGMVDRSIEIRVYDEVALRAVIAARPSIRGARRLAAALDRLDERSGDFRSEFERRVTRLVQDSEAIPAPVVNVLVTGYRPDLWWVGTRAIVECDGRDYHRSMAQRLADSEREDALRAMGFVFLRLRYDDLRYDETGTLRRIEAFVLANQAAPEPAAV